MNNFPTTKQTVSVDDLHPNTWNPNKQSDFIFQKAKESIQKFGFIDPILVRETDTGFEIIDGEHRWRAAKELGYTEILAENLGSISVEEAKALTILINNIRGEDDPIKRGELFAELKLSSPDLLNLMPFSEQLISDEINLIDFDLNYESEKPNDPTTTVYRFVVPNELVPEINQILDSFGATSSNEAFVELVRQHKTL